MIVKILSRHRLIDARIARGPAFFRKLALMHDGEADIGTFIMPERGENQENLDLVAKFKATGDNRHFEALFDRHQKRVYSIAYAIFQNREMAEDLVQEIFVRAFEQIASFDESDPQSDFCAWLSRICRSAYFDGVRKSQEKVERDMDLLLRYYVAGEDEDQICADLDLTREQFRRILFRVRKRFRELYIKNVGKS